ncbi:Chaperone protein dnaJ [Hordeum vulgare]|nr:Chaperone protein dnaJ [Hordeum vulgare]
MLWEWDDGDEAARTGDEVPVDFDFFSFFAKPKVKDRLSPFDSSAGLLPAPLGQARQTSGHRRVWDYYKILEVDYDASEETIRSSYIRLALKWHPDKKQDEEKATSRFQDINEAYQVLSNPAKRQEYDKKGVLYVQDQNAADYLNRHKGLILTCNGLGVRLQEA